MVARWRYFLLQAWPAKGPWRIGEKWKSIYRTNYAQFPNENLRSLGVGRFSGHSRRNIITRCLESSSWLWSTDTWTVLSGCIWNEGCLLQLLPTPRIKLQGAVIVARLRKTIEEGHSVEIKRTFFGAPIIRSYLGLDRTRDAVDNMWLSESMRSWNCWALKSDDGLSQRSK